MCLEPVNIGLNQGPSGTARRRLGTEERQHMRVDPIHSVKYILCTPILLKAVGHIGDGDVDAILIQSFFRGSDVGGELRYGKDLIEQRFGSELDDAGDELGFGVRFKVGIDSIPPLFPLVPTVESEPYKLMETETVVPCSVNEIVEEPCFVASAVETDVARTVGFFHIFEFLLKLGCALAWGERTEDR